MRATPTQTPQSASERRAAEAALRVLISDVAPAHARLINSLRRMLRKRLPSAHELVYEYRGWFVISFSPSEHGYQGVLAIRASPDGVKFYFNRGKDFPDPEKLLKGAGGLVRFIDIKSASDLARPAVARLIDLALVRNDVPFALMGRGSIIIRSTSANESAPAKKPSRGKTVALPKKPVSAKSSALAKKSRARQSHQRRRP